MRAGWFSLGLLLGLMLGAAGAVVGLEVAVKQHRDAKSRSAVQAWDLRQELAVARSWAPCGKKRGK